VQHTQLFASLIHFHWPGKERIKATGAAARKGKQNQTRETGSYQ
jgi:hypothetical protein